MTNFDIINALETYAIDKGYQFVYANAGTKGAFERNINTAKRQNKEEIIFFCDFIVQPTYTELGKRTGIEYTCLIMLGNKFDVAGNAASLSERHKQKYDRRTLPLLNAFDTFISEFTCQNKLQVEVGTVRPEINVFDTNIDMVVCDSVVFTQL